MLYLYLYTLNGLIFAQIRAFVPKSAKINPKGECHAVAEGLKNCKDDVMLGSGKGGTLTNSIFEVIQIPKQVIPLNQAQFMDENLLSF